MLLTGLGGALGAITRYGFGQLLYNRRKLPLNTFAVNTLGSLLLGLAASAFHNGQLPIDYWQLIGVGFLGSFTTFSTFSYEAIRMLLEKKTKTAIAYVGLSIVVSLVFINLGFSFLQYKE